MNIHRKGSNMRRHPTAWPYEELFLLEAADFPGWLTPQAVPEPLKHLTLRRFCTFRCPLFAEGVDYPDSKCLNLCLRPVCVNEHGHSEHYCSHCVADGSARKHKASKTEAARRHVHQNPDAECGASTAFMTVPQPLSYVRSLHGGFL